ncbi:MAG: hypothetical protein FWF77_01320 [Defluviitaleaceae bacterium]|nr:hypothetical protein [Defluviitaleaceae bacterium]
MQNPFGTLYSCRCINSSARQARGGHHGRSERSERFPRHRGNVLAAAHSLEAGYSFPAQKKTSRRVTLADSSRKFLSSAQNFVL